MLSMLAWGSATAADGGVTILATVSAETVQRSTNFREDAYRFRSAAGAIKVSVYAQDPNSPFWLASPYVTARVARSNHDDAPYENELVYGIGLESWMLGRWDGFGQDALRWAASGNRLYVEYLRRVDLADAQSSWIPEDDWRIGVDRWQAFNLLEVTSRDASETRGNRFWGSIWYDAGYRSTGFYDPAFHSYSLGVNLRAGYMPFYPLLPYLTTQACSNQWYPLSWENRWTGGAGIRVPLWGRSDVASLRALHLYVEWLAVLSYFRKEPLDSPRHDFAVGLRLDGVPVLP